MVISLSTVFVSASSESSSVSLSVELSSSTASSSKSTDGSEEVIQVATGQSMAPFCYLDADGNLVGYAKMYCMR